MSKKITGSSSKQNLKNQLIDENVKRFFPDSVGELKHVKYSLYKLNGELVLIYTRHTLYSRKFLGISQKYLKYVQHVYIILEENEETPLAGFCIPKSFFTYDPLKFDIRRKQFQFNMVYKETTWFAVLKNSYYVPMEMYEINDFNQEEIMAVAKYFNHVLLG